MYRLLKLALGLLCLSTAACQKGCQKPGATSTEEAKVETNGVNNFKKLDFTGLNDAQKKSIAGMLNEEVCPCGCPNTFAECINADGCEAGELLVKWSIDRLKEGAPEHFLYKAVASEINSGFLSEKRDIDTMDAYVKGAKDASLTIVEFADFECPMCKYASAEMNEFVKKYSDQVQIYFMHFPLNSHPNAERAAIAAEAAGKLGKFWEIHDLMFAFNGPLTDENIKTLAQKLFDMKQMAQFEKHLQDPEIKKKIQKHRDYAINNLKLVGTPTFLFNGRPYNLSSSVDGYELRLAMEKARAKIDCGKK